MKMRAGGKHALDGGEFFRDETRHFLQAGAHDENQQIVGARHEVAGLDLVETADPVGQAIESAPRSGVILHLDDGAHGRADGSLARQIEHWTPAEEDFSFFNCSRCRLTSASDIPATCAICFVESCPPSINSLRTGFMVFSEWIDFFVPLLCHRFHVKGMAIRIRIQGDLVE